MSAITVVYPVILLLLLLVASTAIRVMREYQRAVVFTLGRFTGVKGPGLIILVPYAQQMVRVDLRSVVLDVPSQDVISRDNVSVKVNAVVHFRVVDADKAVTAIENFQQATSQLSQTTLRSVLGKHTPRPTARQRWRSIISLVARVTTLRVLDAKKRREDMPVPTINTFVASGIRKFLDALNSSGGKPIEQLSPNLSGIRNSPSIKTEAN
jgi:hypothetical protein